MFIAPPVNANINVLDIVPIISFPTCIPDLNSSFAVSSGRLLCISSIVAEMETATSITAPREAINIPEKNTPPI